MTVAGYFDVDGHRYPLDVFTSPQDEGDDPALLRLMLADCRHEIARLRNELRNERNRDTL